MGETVMDFGIALLDIEEVKNVFEWLNESVQADSTDTGAATGAGSTVRDPNCQQKPSASS